MKEDIDVEIFGYKYRIKSQEQADHVHKLAEYLNEKIEEVLQTTKTVDSLNVVILSSLNIANDLFRVRFEQGDLQRQIEERSRRLISLIDAQVGNGDRILD